MTGSPGDTVVYTAIFDDYDVLTDPREPNERVDYVCFTDDPGLTSEVWEIEHVQEEELPPNELNRQLKILPHQNAILSQYEYSVYVDGNIHLTGDIESLLEKYRELDFACPAHNKRDCVYDEAEACIESSKGDPSEIDEQMSRYRAEGLPEDRGLGETSVLFRRHSDPELQALLEDWWEEFNRGASRDQLSLPYVLWKRDREWEFIDESPRRENDYFRITGHLPGGSLQPLHRAWLKSNAYRDRSIGYSLVFHVGSAVRRVKSKIPV